MDPLAKIDLEEILINEVSAHSCLFNKKDVDYNNRTKKKKIWEKISHLLNYPVPQCKSKWKNMKDTFFHYVRLEKNTPSGSRAEKKIKWVHYDALQFLLPCLDEPSTISNYAIEAIETGAVEEIEIGAVEEIEKLKDKKQKSNVEDVILQAIQSLDDKQPEPVSESKLFLDSLVPRFERLSRMNRSFIEFKILELLHQIEFESSELYY